MITKRQREERIKRIYASDMWKILSGHAHDIWLEKTGKVDLALRPITVDMDMGNAQEPVALGFAERRLGKLIRNQHRVADEFHLGAHNDALRFIERSPVEAKCAASRRRDEFGEEGSDQVPNDVLVQVHVQMICDKSDISDIAAILAHFSIQFLMFQVPYCDALGDIIKTSAVNLWEKHIVRDIPPPNSMPSLDVVKYMRKTPKKIISIPGIALKTWRTAQQKRLNAEKEILKPLEEQEEQAKAAMLALMGDAEAAVVEETGEAVTHFLEPRKGFMVAPNPNVRTLRYKAKGL